MTILNKEKLLEVARALADEGRLDKAVKEYEKILQADPSDLRVKIKLAELQVRRKHVAEAIKIYKEVAEIYEQDSFFLKAVTVYKNILKLNPALIEINEKLAVLYQKMGLVSDAVRQYEILAVALEQQNEWSKLLDVRRKISELQPKDGAARIRLAEIFQRQGMLEEAIDQYEIYARQLEEEGKNERLPDIYERILPHRPNNKEMLRKLIKIYHERSEHKKVLAWLETAKALVSEDIELLRLKAETYASFNQLETARVHYQDLAELLVKHHKADEALLVWEEVCFISPGVEDNLKGRIEEVKPGSWDSFCQKLAARRKKAEQEGLEEAEAAEAGKEKKAAKEQPQKQPPAQQPKAAEKPSEKIPEKKVDAAKPSAPPEEKAKPAPPSPAIDQNRIQELEACLNLGKAYWEMGLFREARSEWAKAQKGYSELFASDQKWRPVLSEVRRLLIQKDGDPLPSKSAPQTQKETKDKETSEGEKDKKKKISFI